VLMNLGHWLKSKISFSRLFVKSLFSVWVLYYKTFYSRNLRIFFQLRP
jgi:hypothetical protein